MSDRSDSVRRVCPVCASRPSQLVNPDCPSCHGAGVIDLVAVVLAQLQPAILAEASRLAKVLAQSEDQMTLLAMTGAINRTGLVTQWNESEGRGSLPKAAAAQQAAAPSIAPVALVTKPSTAAPQPLLSKPLLTTEEVAEILGLNRRTIENWRYKETGPVPVKVGRNVRYQGEVIREWINNLPNA